MISAGTRWVAKRNKTAAKVATNPRKATAPLSPPVPSSVSSLRVHPIKPPDVVGPLRITEVGSTAGGDGNACQRHPSRVQQIGAGVDHHRLAAAPTDIEPELVRLHTKRWPRCRCSSPDSRWWRRERPPLHRNR